jgi:hypothetical protein
MRAQPSYRVAASVLLLACVMSASCVVCDEADCRPELRVSVRETGDLALVHGTWTFTVSLDDAEPLSETCEIAIGSSIATCEGDLDIESFPGLPGAPIHSLEFSFAADDERAVPAAKIDIRIEREDASLHDEEHTPIYRDPESDGRCNFGCKHADVDIVVDA